jgi:hypothetical protein
MRALCDAGFVCESPANAGRGVEVTRYLTLAKTDFADQSALDSYIVARGGSAGTFVCVDLGTVGTA